MKFYMHCENPELTVVIRWEETDGVISDSLNTFKQTLAKRNMSVDYSQAKFCLTNAKGKVLDFSAEVNSVVKHMDDLYVKIELDEEKTACTKIVQESVSEVVASESTRKSPDETSQDPKMAENLEGMKNAAVLHTGNERYRKAIAIYKDMLKLDGKCQAALKGLSMCYRRAGRHKEALRFAKKGLSMFKDDVDFLMLVGEGYVHCKDGDAAIETMARCVTVARSGGGVSTLVKQDIQVLLAKAYLLKNEKDTAIAILQGVLRQSLDHEEALIEYAAMLFPLGPKMSEDAMNILLTAMARRENDPRARQVFAEVMATPRGMEALRDVGTAVMEDAAALVFLANCLRDHSVLKQAIELFEIAMKVDPSNPSIALIYIHTLELTNSHVNILDFVLEYLKKFPDKCIGEWKCSSLKKHLLAIPKDLKHSTEVADAMVLCEGENVSCEAPSRDYTDEERYFLAFLFTVVKVLFIEGMLSYLPPILSQLEPLYQGRQLHESNIRNEAAYFNCISELFKVYPTIPSTRLSSGEKYLYMIGDSHCIPPAWQNIKVQEQDFVIHPILSTGTKIWHLRPESNFYPKTNLRSAIRNIPDGAIVTVCLGEIDCREAMLQCWEKARYERIEDGMEAVIQIYMKVLNSLHHKHGWKIFVHPVLPVLDLTRPIVMQFNRILATRLLKESNLHWLNFVQELLAEDEEQLKAEFQFDGTHIHPRYLGLLSEALSRVS